MSKIIYIILGIIIIILAILLFIGKSKQNNFQTKIKAQGKIISSLREEVATLKAEKSKLENRVVAWETTYQASEKEYKKKLTQAKLECSAQEKKWADKNLQLEEQIKVLTAKNKELLNTNKKNTAFTTDLYKQLVSEQDKTAQLKEQLRGAENKIKQLTTENQSLKNKQKIIQEIIKKAQSDLRQAAAEKQNLKKEIKTLQARNQNWQTQLQAAKDKMAEYLGQARKAQEALTEKEKILAQTQKKLTAAEQEIERLKLGTEILLKENDKLSAQLKKEKAELVATIYFATGKAEITKNEEKKLTQALRKIGQKKREYICIIRGTADQQPYPSESSFFNSRLSAQRALSVARLFLKNKIQIPIIIEGQGNFFAQPPKDNRKERRVEILIIEKEALK